MADKIKAIKIKQKNGTYSEEVPISVNVQNVQWDENNHTLLDALGSVDISSSGKGNLQHQIDELDGDKISTNQFNSRLNNFLREQISADTTDWLDDNVNPVGSAVIVDKTLTIEGAAADALAVKTELNKKANASNTYTKAEVNAAIDAKQIEVDDTLSITGTAADAKAVGDEFTIINESLNSVQADLTAKAVLFTEQDKTEEEKAIARNNIGAMADDADLLTDEIKSALLNIFKHVVYTDGEEDYYDALYQLFYNGGDSKAIYELLNKYIIDSEIDTGIALSNQGSVYTIIADVTDCHIFTDDTDIQRVLLTGVQGILNPSGTNRFVGPKIFVNRSGVNSKTYFINNTGVTHNYITDNGKHSVFAIIRCENLQSTDSLWIDGAKVFENTGSMYADAFHGENCIIGNESGLNRFWNGDIYKLRIYDYILSDEEINELTSKIVDKSQLLKIEKTYYSNRRTETDIQTNARTQDLTIIVKATHESVYDTDELRQYVAFSSVVMGDGHTNWMGVKLYVNTTNNSKTITLNCMGVTTYITTGVQSNDIFGILRFKTDQDGTNVNSYVYLNVDGSEKETTLAPNNYYNHDAYLIIGDDADTNAAYKRRWDGYIEAEVYNRALSDEEIQVIKERVITNGIL